MSQALLRNVGKAGDKVWRRLPPPVREGPSGRLVGNWIHALSRKFSSRGQSGSTWFLRNEPLLSTILEIVNGSFPLGATIRLCSMACSSGAELYSLLWLIRKARPDLEVVSLGVDISEAALERARRACYLRDDMEFRGSIYEEAFHGLFETDGEVLRVKDTIQKGVRWARGDARDPAISLSFGLQDVVLANNFLIHMEPYDASAALMNVARLVKSGGILVCRGADLNVRQKVVKCLGLKPVPIRLEQIHNAELDLDARRHWPWKYYGLEPLNRNRKDCIQRYTAVFQAPMQSLKSL
jgi:chemotaxis methyl-accepting protein methylase